MVPNPTCRSCGTRVADVAFEGYCATCLATAAFEPSPDDETDSGDWKGRRLGGHELLEELGRGGMGVVYRAYQPELRREVALKILRSGPFASREEIARFRFEAGAAAGLQHPNIVAVHTVGESDGHLYFSMDLVRGRTLAELTADGPLEPRRAARYVRSIAHAIEAAHQQGVLHRDLKPGNILIDQDDRPRITDFGISRRLDAGDATLTMGIAGSPAYMSPEQADPRRGRATATSDVYSLGALLYHLLGGRPPFAAASSTATLAQVLNDEPASLRRLNSTVPRDLETICFKCLRKDPARRFPTAAALADDLDAFLENRPISARPVTAFEKGLLWVRRHPGMSGLGATLALTVAVGAGLGLWQARAIRLNLHAADLRIASESVELGNLGRARELLEMHRPAPGAGDFAWHYLNKRAEGDARTLLGRHAWIVGAAAWSPDGSRLASASVSSGTVGSDVRVWTADETGAPPLILGAIGARELAWFPDNQRLLAVHFDDRLRIWNTPDGRVVTDLPARSAGLSKDGRLLVTCEGDPYAWDANGPTGAVVLHDLESGGRRSLPDARLATIDPTGTLLATTDFRGEIHLYETVNLNLRRSLNSEGEMWSLVFSPDASHLAVAGFDKDVRLFDLRDSDSRPRRLRGHTLNTWRAAFSPDGATLASSSSDQTIRLWDVATGARLGNLRGHGGEVWCVAYSPDGRRLASGGKDRSVFVWPGRPSSGDRVLEAHRYSRPFFSPDARRLIASAADGSEATVVHDLQTGESLRVPGTGEALAMDSSTGSILFYDGDFHYRWQEPDAADPLVKGRLEHEVGEDAPARRAVSPDGALLVGINRAGRLSAWRLVDGVRQRAIELPGVDAWELQVSPDGRWVAVTAGEQGFWLCSLRTGHTRRLTAHLDQGKQAAFSPDGRKLATASVDATIKLWDVATGREEFTFRGHPTEVTGVAFAPDGVTLASAELERGVRLWHLPTRREVVTAAFPDAAGRITFSPDGRMFGVLQVDGTVRVLTVRDR